jgi:hypothetical protein
VSSIDEAARARLKTLFKPEVWRAINALDTDRIKAIAVTSNLLTSAEADILGMDPEIARAMGLLPPESPDGRGVVYYLPSTVTQ